MMKKKTVRLISCVIAGASCCRDAGFHVCLSLTFAAAADDEDADSLQSKLDSLEEEKAAGAGSGSADLTKQADDVQATRDARRRRST